MKLKSLLVTLAVIFIVAVSGCQKASQDTLVFNRYNMATLNVSTSADIVPMIQAEKDLLAKSENAIASWGEAKKGSIIWFNAVAFDDFTSKAVRKYAFGANPKADGFFSGREQTMRFDAELVINADVLREPHANDNARKIAVLKSVLKDFGNDMKPLTKDSEVLNSAMLMSKQLLKGIIYELGATPSLAANLENYSGMDFDNMNLNKGKIRMVIVDGVVKIKAMTGSAIKDFHQKLDIIGM